jgi:hypothetical protein
VAAAAAWSLLNLECHNNPGSLSFGLSLGLLLRRGTHVVDQVPVLFGLDACAFLGHILMAILDDVKEFPVGAVFQSSGIGFPALAIPVEKKSEFVCPPEHLEAPGTFGRELRKSLPWVGGLPSNTF